MLIFSKFHIAYDILLLQLGTVLVFFATSPINAKTNYLPNKCKKYENECCVKKEIYFLKVTAEVFLVSLFFVLLVSDGSPLY